MRVDSRELPLATIPLCQLLPCHFGPPKPTLSINLYVKGCLDCTIVAFHMSIPSESSLLQNEVQILNAKLHKLLIGPGGDNVLWPDIADLSDHCPVISLQTLEVRLCQWPSLAWSIMLRTQELYTRPRVLKERWCEEKTGSRSLNFFQAVFTHVVVESSQPLAAESMSPTVQLSCGGHQVFLRRSEKAVSKGEWLKPVVLFRRVRLNRTKLHLIKSVFSTQYVTAINKF